MAVREILRYPNRTLSKKCAEVTAINGNTAGMLNSMVDTMYAANGIGLAAPQIGELCRAIVVDTDTEDRGKKLVKLINPVLVEAEGKFTWEEGCLSVVNYTAEVTRPQKILVRAWTIEHREIEFEAEDLQAICIQHEIDHLDGVLFIDRISRLKREMYRKRLKKMAREAQAVAASRAPAI